MLKIIWCTRHARREGKACPTMGTQISILAFSVCSWKVFISVFSLLIFLVLYANVYQERYTVKYLIWIWLPRRRLCVRMSYFGPPPPPRNTSSPMTWKLVNHHNVLLTFFEFLEFLGILKQTKTIYVSKMAFPIFNNSHKKYLKTCWY